MENKEKSQFARYFGTPRWRWLLFIPITFSVLPFGLLTLATLTYFNGMRLWGDLFDWALYEDERKP